MVCMPTNPNCNQFTHAYNPNCNQYIHAFLL